MKVVDNKIAGKARPEATINAKRLSVARDDVVICYQDDRKRRVGSLLYTKKHRGSLDSCLYSGEKPLYRVSRFSRRQFAQTNKVISYAVQACSPMALGADFDGCRGRQRIRKLESQQQLDKVKYIW